jgi:hypothetical protein
MNPRRLQPLKGVNEGNPDWWTEWLTGAKMCRVMSKCAVFKEPDVS